MTITGGEWSIRTGDDGIHADAAVLIQAGNFTILYCYEGVEGQSVTIDSGTLDITARDDGLNAAGGADGSESGTGGMGGDRGGMGGRGDMDGGKPFGAEKAGGQGMPRDPGQQRSMPGATA